jgi:hypothetical protein
LAEGESRDSGPGAARIKHNGVLLLPDARGSEDSIQTWIICWRNCYTLYTKNCFLSVKIRCKIKKRNIGWSFTLLLASGQCIMGLQIMKSIGYWDQIYPDWQVPNYSFVLYVCGSSFPYYYHSVIRITLFQSQSNPLKRLPLYLLVFQKTYFRTIFFCHKIMPTRNQQALLCRTYSPQQRKLSRHIEKTLPI